MKRLALVVLCVAIPARGDHTTQHTERLVNTLSQIERFPTRPEIDQVLADPVAQLRTLALDPAADFGVRLRAIRSLPLYCSNTCTLDPAHAAIIDLFPRGPSNGSGQNVLLLRACIEALGETASRLDEDADLVSSFLGHGSRDIRAVSARALGTLCNVQAADALRARFNVESSAQVQHAIADALQRLDECN